MNVFKVEEYFDNPDHMNDLLGELQEKYFSRIEYHGSLFRGGALSDDVQLKATLDELTGIFIELNPIYHVIETIKKNREESYYISRKTELESKGDKVIATSLEKEASNFVAHERVVRNAVFGNVEACSQGISTCQSKLKHVGKEIELAK